MGLQGNRHHIVDMSLIACNSPLRALIGLSARDIKTPSFYDPPPAPGKMFKTDSYCEK